MRNWRVVMNGNRLVHAAEATASPTIRGGDGSAGTVTVPAVMIAGVENDPGLSWNDHSAESRTTRHARLTSVRAYTRERAGMASVSSVVMLRYDIRHAPL